MWHMAINQQNRPCGWSEEPQEGYIEVSQAVRDIHEAHADYVWDGATLVEPPPVLPVEPTPYIPQSITPRQARLVLSRAGLLPAINTTIAAIGGEAQIEWEYANEVLRSNPLLAVVAQQAGLTDAQLDQMFIEAAGL